MNHFSVNGNEVTLPESSDQSQMVFEQLMNRIQKEFVNDLSLISSISVDGKQISIDEETAMAKRPLSEIERVEVLTAHPRELAQETLQTLIPYVSQLKQLSEAIGERLWSGEDIQSEFKSLIEGLEVVADSIASAKHILRIGQNPTTEILEKDLASLLKDLFETMQTSGEETLAFKVEILRRHLPMNLEDWAASGIPALIRSRDS
ncbi:MAG: hypothetical protein JNL01_09335 [Bdellovibrionales bacterium]|nr:hypothetical protein [Bdellovibrionales bacterium]